MKTNKKITLGIASTIAVVTIPVTTAIACGSKKEKEHHRKGRGSADDNKNNKLISKEERKIRNEKMEAYKKQIAKFDDDKDKVIDSKAIKLVSLGDSVASGFTLLEGLSDKHRGYYDPQTKEVSGISYGSYLARAFQKQKVLGDFNNFSIAGSTTETLAGLVDPQYELSRQGKEKKMEIGFLVQGKEKERFKKVQQKIKDANLITISIGANDILGRIKLGGLSIPQLLKNPRGLDFSKGLDGFIDFGSEVKMKEEIEKAKLNLLHTIAKIKEMNSNAKIVLVGYPMPVAQLAPLLKMVETTDKNGVKQSIANKLMGMLASISSSISKQFKTIDFIDANVPNEWDAKATILAPKLLDIHPGPKGYREMAGTILANLSGIRGINSQISNKGDIEKRLKKNYENIVGDYLEIGLNGEYHPVPLDKEGQIVQDKSRPEELLMFTSKIIDKLINTLLPSSPNSPAPIIEAKNNYTGYSLSMSTIMAKLQNMAPLVISLLKSAEGGAKSTDKEISESSKQNIKYIIAKLGDSAMKLINQQTGSIKGMIAKMIPDLGTTTIQNTSVLLQTGFASAIQYIHNTPGLSWLESWMIQNPQNGKIIEDTIKKGVIIPKDYQ